MHNSLAEHRVGDNKLILSARAVKELPINVHIVFFSIFFF